MENTNANQVEGLVGREVREGVTIIYCVNAVIGDDPSDNGYVCILSNGEKEFVPASILNS